MPSNSFSRRRGNWRRPAVCESKKKSIDEEPDNLPAVVRVNANWFAFAPPPTSSASFNVNLTRVGTTNVYVGTANDTAGRTISIELFLILAPGATAITATVPGVGANTLVATWTPQGWNSAIPFQATTVALSFNLSGYSGGGAYAVEAP